MEISHEKLATDEDMEDEEDFYGYIPDSVTINANGAADTTGGAFAATVSSKNAAPSYKSLQEGLPSSNEITSKTVNSVTEQRKAQNQKRADELRAKLIAQKQSTPIKNMSRAATPSKPPVQSLQSATNSIKQGVNDTAFSDISTGLEALLADGKAAAEAKLKEAVNGIETQQPQTKSQPSSPPTAEQNHSAPQDALTVPQSAAQATDKSTWATKLTDAYYTDLPIWLELTGYHDVEYRESKLRTHKERKALEQEYARKS